MTEKQAAAGWYPVENGERWWDGEAWTDQLRSAEGVLTSASTTSTATSSLPWGPLTYIVVGVIGSIGGGVLFALGADSGDDGLVIVGWLVLMFASVFFLIGVIAKGVVVGIRASRQE